MSATNFDSLAVKAEDSITAYAGGGAANARQLTAAANRIATVATAADSVKLPQLSVGEFCMVYNSTANSAQVFPKNSTDTINGTAGSTGVALAAGKSAIYMAFSAGVIGTNLSA